MRHLSAITATVVIKVICLSIVHLIKSAMNVDSNVKRRNNQSYFALSNTFQIINDQTMCRIANEVSIPATPQTGYPFLQRLSTFFVHYVNTNVLKHDR